MLANSQSAGERHLNVDYLEAYERTRSVRRKRLTVRLSSITAANTEQVGCVRGNMHLLSCPHQ